MSRDVFPVFLTRTLIRTPVRRLILAGFLLASAGLTGVPQAAADEAIRQAVTRAVGTHAPRDTTVAVHVVGLDEGGATTIFAQNASRQLIPASNLKLLTTAAALDVLGPDFRFRTLLLVRGEATGGVEVAVVGDGDPSFGDARLLAGVDGWGTRTVFQSWANLLKKAGVTRVRSLRFDDGVFDDVFDHPNWPDNQRHRWYAAQVGGLNFNLNCVDVYLTRPSGGSVMQYRLDPPTRYVNVRNTCQAGDSNAVWLTRPPGGNEVTLGGQTDAARQGPLAVTIHDPGAYFAGVLAETLTEEGVSVAEVARDLTVRTTLVRQALAASTDVPGGGEASAVTPPEQPWQIVAVHETPLSTVLARTNKDSVNLYAESLAKRMAFARTQRPGTWADADAVVREYLAAVGTDAESTRLDDGSGLSRQNRVTAAALSDVLAAIYASDGFDVYRASLSQAGTDGTLRNRFAGQHQPLRGRVFGKTGYISGVSTFTGYLQARDGRWFVVSVLVNDAAASIGQAKTLQEEVVAAVDRAAGR